MESTKELANTSSDLMRKWTAAELGMKPVFCRVCGKEKTWRKADILGSTLRVPIMCQCEVDLEEEEKRKEEARQKQERLERTLAASNLGKRFADASFDSWERDPKTDNCYLAVKEYAENFDKGISEGLCVYGTAGNGKSHLAAALVNSVIQRGFTAVFYEVPALFTEIKASFDRESGTSESKILNSLGRCDLLVLDDAGAEKPSQWVQEKFYQIINARYTNNLPVVITTNTKDMAGLEDIIGFRAYDRVLEMCRPLKNSGESYRRRIAIDRLKG